MIWEYKIVNINSSVWKKELATKVEEQLNTYGKDGWELVDVYFDHRGILERCIFKRPKPN